MIDLLANDLDEEMTEAEAWHATTASSDRCAYTKKSGEAGGILPMIDLSANDLDG